MLQPFVSYSCHPNRQILFSSVDEKDLHTFKLSADTVGALVGFAGLLTRVSVQQDFRS